MRRISSRRLFTTSFLINTYQFSSFAFLNPSLGRTKNNMVTSRASVVGEEMSNNEFPVPISVNPGTSPVEEQPAMNPIDKSCTILIVGASRGIGLEFVKKCLEKEATVIASYRGTEVPAQLISLQEQFPAQRLHFIPIELTSELSIEDAARKIKKNINNSSIGLISHIIHNGGIYLPETSFDGAARGPRTASPKVTKDAMMKTYEINAVAPLLIAQHFVPLLGVRRSDETNHDSTLLFPILAFMTSKVGSVDDNGSGGAYAYRSSKSALNNIAKSLSNDLRDEARVVLLHPGYVQTDMTGGKGFITTEESVTGLLKALEATDGSQGFRFVDYKANLIPW